MWCCLILAQVYHALQVEVAAESGIEVLYVSIALLIRLTPGWFQAGLSPKVQAVRYGRDLSIIGPSTRHRVQVPWIDPIWVVPPPEQAVQPYVKVRHRPRSSPKGRPQRICWGRWAALALPALHQATALDVVAAQPLWSPSLLLFADS